MKKSKFIQKIIDNIKDTLTDMSALDDFTIKANEDTNVIMVNFNGKKDSLYSPLEMYLDYLYQRKESEDVKVKDLYRENVLDDVQGFVEQCLEMKNNLAINIPKDLKAELHSMDYCYQNNLLNMAIPHTDMALALTSASVIDKDLELNPYDYIDKNDYKIRESGNQVYLTSDNNNGSVHILNKKAMKDVANILGEDFYIVPVCSSNILCVNIEDDDLEKISDFLKSQNDRMNRKDILSNSIYKYDFENNQLYEAEMKDKER